MRPNPREALVGNLNLQLALHRADDLEHPERIDPELADHARPRTRDENLARRPRSPCAGTSQQIFAPLHRFVLNLLGHYCRRHLPPITRLGPRTRRSSASSSSIMALKRRTADHVEITFVRGCDAKYRTPVSSRCVSVDAEMSRSPQSHYVPFTLLSPFARCRRCRRLPVSLPARRVRGQCAVQVHLPGLAALRLAARRARKSALRNDRDLVHRERERRGDRRAYRVRQPRRVALKRLGRDDELLLASASRSRPSTSRRTRRRCRGARRAARSRPTRCRSGRSCDRG